jgi:hypothetical protein
MVTRDVVTGQYTGASMESVKGQVADVVALPKGAIKDVMRRPIALVGSIFLTLVLVLLIEAYKPGIITGPIRRLLQAVGVKTA